MKKATKIKEIYNIFDPQRYLEEETKDYYVDIYKDFTDDIAKRFMLSDSEETIFVAGQSGNGKSSALQLFSSNYSDLNSEYDIKVLNARDIFDKKDIDVADVMLMIAFTIVEENEELKKEFFDILETMRKTKLNELEESHEMSNLNAHTHQANVLSGFQFDLGFLKIGADFKNTFKTDSQNKKTIRKLVKFKKQDFIDKINEIIRKYKRTFLENEKRLLLIIDDIEKIKNSDHIFTDEMSTLLQIECSKIITMPIHLKRSSTFAGYTAKEISFKWQTREGEILPDNLNKLIEIINIRLDNTALIDEDAKILIAKKSGGNLRQLIKLVKESALKAYSPSSNLITLYDVESAIFDIKRDYSSASVESKEFLDYINAHKNPQDYSDESIKKLKNATEQSLIFAYFNGSIWYDLNPIIDEV
jgi:Cdc6-like AAA superfamily ATPase